MSKLSDSQVLALKALANGSIQDESAAFAGEPTSIMVDESEPSKFKLKAKFVNTDQVMASDWIEQTMSDLHFGIDQYVIELEGDDDTEVTASAVFNLDDTVQGSIINNPSSTPAQETTSEAVPKEAVSDDTSDGTTDDTTSTEQEQELEDTTEANTMETTETAETTEAAESNEDDIDEEINVDMNHLTHHARLAAFTTVSVSEAEPTQASKQATPAENSSTSNTPASDAVIAEASTEKAETNKAAFKEAKKRKGPSAFARFKEIVDKAIPNMTSETIAQLTDSTFCKEKAHIAYPILIEVDPASDYKSQATFRGKYRYSKKVLSILGKDYYITNHIFERNVAITQDLFTNMKLI